MADSSSPSYESERETILGTMVEIWVLGKQGSTVLESFRVFLGREGSLVGGE